MDKVSREEELLKIPGVVGVAHKGREIVIYMNGSHVCEGYYCKGLTHVHATDKSGGIDTMELKQEAISVHRERWRPVPGGVSGAYDIEGETPIGGTVGAVVSRNGDDYFLSNAHVFGFRADIPVTQPSPKDGGTIDDEIGVTYAVSPINFKGYNELDAAIAKAEVDVSDNILGDGVIIGTKEAYTLMSVEKTGRDGYSKGRILTTLGTFKVNYESGNVALFRDVVVTTPMAKPGDSGSILTHDERGYKYAVGLLFAGSDYLSLHLPIRKILCYFGVKFPGE